MTPQSRMSPSGPPALVCHITSRPSIDHPCLKESGECASYSATALNCLVRAGLVWEPYLSLHLGSGGSREAMQVGCASFSRCMLRFSLADSDAGLWLQATSAWTTQQASC